MTGEWGLAFEQDSSLATVSGSAAAVDVGGVVCFLVEPGKLPFQRHMRQRTMVWMVADVE